MCVQYALAFWQGHEIYSSVSRIGIAYEPWVAPAFYAPPCEGLSLEILHLEAAFAVLCRKARAHARLPIVWLRLDPSARHPRHSQ